MKSVLISVFVLSCSLSSWSLVIRSRWENDPIQIGQNLPVGESVDDQVNSEMNVERVERSTFDREDAQKKFLENLANLTEVLANSSSLQQHRGITSDIVMQDDQNEMASILLKPLLGGVVPSSSASITQSLYNVPERSPKSGASVVNVFKSVDNQQSGGSCSSNDTQRQLLNALFNRMAGDFEMAQTLLMENKNCPGKDSSKQNPLSLTVQSLPAGEGRLTRLTWTRKKSCEKRKKINQAGFGCDNKQLKSQFQSSDEVDKTDEVLPSDSIKDK